MSHISPAYALPPTATSSSPNSPRTCSRRRVLTFTFAAATSICLPALAETDLANVNARNKVTNEVSLYQFAQDLEQDQVKAAWFYGTFADYCCYLRTDGTYAHITQGYPIEAPRSPESPAHVMAELRNRGVPYFVSPIDKTLLHRRQ